MPTKSEQKKKDALGTIRYSSLIGQDNGDGCIAFYTSHRSFLYLIDPEQNFGMKNMLFIYVTIFSLIDGNFFFLSNLLKFSRLTWGNFCCQKIENMSFYLYYKYYIYNIKFHRN